MQPPKAAARPPQLKRMGNHQAKAGMEARLATILVFKLSQRAYGSNLLCSEDKKKEAFMKDFFQDMRSADILSAGGTPALHLSLLD